MRETISVAAATNQPAETTIPWRLSDNAWRPTTAADLTAVLVAYAYRMAHIFQAFSAWEDKDDGRHSSDGITQGTERKHLIS
jgi:hypothetical protein